MATWNPKSFQDAVAIVHGSTSQALKTVLSVGGPKSCPPPSWDPHGTYRATLVSGIPMIQRLAEDSQWVPADLQPPRQRPMASAPGAAEFQSRTKNILFMDVAGWSGLSAGQIYAYVTNAMPRLGEYLGATDFVNTWGDAIVATFAGAKECAEAALNIRDFFRKAYAHEGVPTGLSCRVSLHSGETIIGHNPLIGRQDIFGHGVHVAARLEPITSAGHVFCTESFAERLSEIDGAAPKPWLLGTLTLPKNSGELVGYAVTWPGDDDPRPYLQSQANSADRVLDDAISVEAISEADGRVALHGWLNSLGFHGSGKAFQFAALDKELGLPPGYSKRLLPGVVGMSEHWKISEQSESMIILRTSPVVRVRSDRRRGW